MTIEEQLKNEILSRYKSVRAFTTAINVPYSTLDSVFKRGISNAGVSTIIKVFNALDLDVESIKSSTLTQKRQVTKKSPSYSDEAIKLAADYDGRMDDRGRENVRSVADLEVARYRAAIQAKQGQPEPDNLIYITRWFPMPMSAGTGQPAGDDEAEELELTKRPPRGTSYIAPVSGDSMEPTYHNGDKLFIRSCEKIEPGQIGVFLMDGQQWVKELGDGVLISHNPDYAPIPMRDDIRCQGLVLGVCDESYFE